jgi:putative transposase
VIDDVEAGPAAHRPGRRIHLVSVITLYRRPVFADAAAAQAVGAVHRQRWPFADTGLLAWLLLPDQWQALLRLGETTGLATVVGRFKAASSRVVEDRHRINGWLWGRGFSERLLAPADDVQAVAAELFAAPLRRGLAERLDDYPHWHAAWRPPAPR